MPLRLLAVLFLAALAACEREAAAPPPPPVAEAPPAPERQAPALPPRQLACLAKAAYFEARGEGESGMKAVMHVVMNRASHPSYPETPCDVVEQRRAASCQFHWYCDGKPDEPANAEVYARALALAEAVAAGEEEDLTGGAVMFHNASVQPYWAMQAQHTATVGQHLFYKLD
jgi:spore germination cell wall hydrolase CwlJ-like protein